MNTLHFRYAVEIEKTRSITQAAENLFMAQPNLSKAIKELENTLGITIFRRTSKGVIPTDQGVKFLGYAKQVLIQIDNMESIRSPEKSAGSRLKLSAPKTGYISRAFAEFAASLSESERIDMQFAETTAMNTISNIRENGFSLGVIRFPLKHEKYFSDYLNEKSLDSQILWDFRAVAVMPSSHPMSCKDILDPEELSLASTELIFDGNEIPYILNLRTAESEDISKKNRLYLCDRASVLDSLSLINNSFILTSPMSAEELSIHGLTQRQCGGEKFRDLLIYTSGHSFDETEIALIDKIYTERNKCAFN